MSDSRSSPNRPRTPQAALDALLASGAGDPLRRALWLDALDLRLRPLLPPSLAAHARLANVDGAKLVFLVDSPVWHARLRLAGPGLVDVARSIGLDVTELVVKTTTQALQPLPPAQRPIVPMSGAARTALESALASLIETEEDPDRLGS